MPAALPASILIVPLLMGGAYGQEHTPFRLIIASLEPTLTPNSVIELAASLGYFEREGVDVELVRVHQTPAALAALQAGEGDMANVAVDGLLKAIEAGADDLRAVVSPNKFLPYTIIAQQSISSVTELEDGLFAIGRLGGLDHTLSTKVLSTLGVDVGRMHLLSAGPPKERSQALAAGVVGATTLSVGTWETLPSQSGLHVLVDQATYHQAAPIVGKVSVVSKQVLEERSEDVAAIVRALIHISRDIAEDPKVWIDAMAAAQPQVDRAVLDSLSVDYAGSWCVNGGLSAHELDETAAWLHGTSDFAGLPQPALADWVDFRFVDAALAELGTIEDRDPADR